MSEDPPTPPREIPTDVVETLATYSPAQLRAIARYTDALAEYREREQRREAGEGTDEADRPDGVPSRATITVKEINDNRYYYWQWREGDKIKSKYEGPVTSDG